MIGFFDLCKGSECLEVLDEQDLSKKAHASVSIADYMFIGTKQLSCRVVQSVNIV